jgi:hypothetical protein
LATYTAEDADCFVYTFKEGILSLVAHDLKLKVSRFTIHVVDADDTTAAAGEARLVDAAFDAASLKVVCAMRDGQDAPEVLADDEKRTIESAIVEEVLHAQEHPMIRFVGRTAWPGSSSIKLRGTLALAGAERTVVVAVRDDGEGTQLVEARLNQTDFGIRPYSAMLGAIKIKSEVRITLRVPNRGKKAIARS